MTSKGRDPGVELEVEGRVSRDNWVKAGSLGYKGSPSWECFLTCFSQAEELNQHFWGSPFHYNIDRPKLHLNDPCADMCTSCCLLKEYLGAIREMTSIMRLHLRTTDWQ